MIAVTWWYDTDWKRYNAKVTDLPAANATAVSQQEMREILVSAYNREAVTSLTEDDFEFTQVAPPAPAADPA